MPRGERKSWQFQPRCSCLFNSLYDGRMQRWHRLLPLGFAATICLFAQGGTSIDNEQARVVIVTDQPHSKGPLHDHKLNRVMIYLQAGRQEITPEGGKRPP
jgi:hypothetical protein